MVCLFPRGSGVVAERTLRALLLATGCAVAEGAIPRRPKAARRERFVWQPWTATPLRASQ